VKSTAAGTWSYDFWIYNYNAGVEVPRQEAIYVW
jgi:hypothetical protein